MSEPINKKDIIVGDPFLAIAKDIEAALTPLENFDLELKKVSASLTTLSKSAETTLEGINSIIEAEKRSKKVVDEKIANDKLLVKVQLEQNRVEQLRLKNISTEALNQEKLNRSRQLTASQNAKNTKAELELDEKLRQSRQKTNFEAKKNAQIKQKLAQDVDRASKLKMKADNDELTSQERLKQAKYRTQEQIEKGIKQKEREAQKTLESERPYNQLSARLNTLRKDYKDLAVAGNENSTSARKMKREIDSLDKTLKNVDGSVGQHTRKVGQYENAFRGLSNVMGTFGLSLGVGFIGREVFNTLSEFDEKVADIVKTTGLARESARELSVELFKIDTRTSITALQELASAAGRLGIKGKENILGFVTSADKAFVALGDDLGGTAEEIATNLGKIAGIYGDEQEFGIEEAINKTGSAINSLASNSKASAGDILDFTNRMAGVSSQANISQTDIQALGAMFAESGQSIEVASTTLNTLLPKLSENQEEFAKTAGMTSEAFGELLKNNPIEALKAVAVGAKSSEGGLNGLVSTLESFGIESARSASIVGVLSNNTDRLTELQEISNKAFKEGTSLQQEFDEKNNTLGSSVERLAKKWDEWVVSMSESTDASNGIKNTINFLADNLPTIISLVTKLGVAFVTFKTFVAVANTDFKVLLQNFTKLKTETAQGEKGISSFGKALKGVGWTVAIGLAIELVHQFYELATGAEQVREQMEAIEKANKRGSKEGERLVQEKRKEIESYKALQEELLSTGEIDQKEYNKRIARREKDFQDRLKQDIRLANESKKRAKEEAQNIASALKAYDEYEQGSSKVTERQFRQSVELIESLGGTDKAHRQIDFLKQRISEENAMLTTLNGSLKTSSSETRGLTLQNNQLASSTKTTTKELENYTQKVKELNDASIKDEQTRQETQLKTKLDQDLADIKANGIMANEFRKALENEYNDAIIKLQKEFNTKREEANQAYWDEIKAQQIQAQADAEALAQLNYDKEIEAITDRDKEIELELKKSGATQDEIEQALLERRIESLKQQIETAEYYGEKAVDLQIQLADLENDIQDKADQEKIERAKEVADKLNEIQEGISQALQEQIDKRIEFSKDEEDQAKSRQSFYEDLAKNGNITAQQSIAEQIELQREAQQEQARLEKQKQQIEMISVGLSTFNASIQSGKSPAGALAETVLSTSALVGILKNINFYEKGTDNAPQGLAVVDEKGAEIITDKHGKIKEIGSGDGARFVNLDRGDKVITATKTAQYFDNLKTANVPKDIAGNSFDLAQINETLKRIESLNKTSKSTVDWGGISGGVANIIEKKTIGRSRTTNLFRS